MSDFITVAELRIEAERLCDENDQLKVENDELKNDADLLRAMLSQVQTEKRCYMADNAKLRELCATVIDDWMSKVCPSFPFCEYGGEYQDCTDETCGNQIYRQMARELGVEVNG